MPTKKQVDRKLAWMLNQLQTLKHLAQGREALFAIQDNPNLSSEEQHLLLGRFESDGIIKLSPVMAPQEWFSHMRATVNFEPFKYTNFYITFLPGFDDSAAYYKKLAPDAFPSNKVTFSRRNYTLRQGSKHHTLDSPTLKSLIEELWPKRTRIDGHGQAIEGNSMTKSALLASTDISSDRLKNSITAFNQQMKRKGIDARISSTKTSIILTAQDE
jgi:hypothetical protein